MNTQEARRELLELANRGLDIVRRLSQGSTVSMQDREALRDLASEARGLLPEAGYPGDAVWRALQRASIGTNTTFDSHDTGYWQDVSQQLAAGADVLTSLVAPWTPRDLDFPIVG